MEKPRLRDSNRLHSHELYPIGEIPASVIRSIGASIVYLLYTGRSDMSGGDWRHPNVSK